MIEINPFPYFKAGFTKPENGIWTVLPKYCTKKDRRVCQSFYDSVLKKRGPHTCPCGLSCLVDFISKNETVIHTGIRINGYYDRKKTKTTLGGDYCPQFTLEVFEKIIQQAQKTSEKITEISNESSKLSERNQINEQFISNTIHEIRKLNADIKAQSEVLSKTLDASDIGRSLYYQKNIFSTSSLISARLNVYDFHINPTLVFSQQQDKIHIYRKFDKISHCLRVRQKLENSRIHLEGQSNSYIMGHKIFELLPFVLLDNALKFSPESEDIYVTFFEEEGSLVVSIRSCGPPLDPGEEKKVFDESYRGNNTKEKYEGSGIGLSLAKKICEIHDINIDVSSKKLSGKHTFFVTLTFDPESLFSE